MLLAAVVRFPARLEANGLSAETVLPLPEAFHERGWRDLISGAEFGAATSLTARDLFAAAPAVVLVPN